VGALHGTLHAGIIAGGFLQSQDIAAHHIRMVGQQLIAASRHLLVHVVCGQA